MSDSPYWNPDWTDPRRAPGGDWRLQRRLNEGFRALACGDDKDLSDRTAEDKIAGGLLPADFGDEP